MEKKELENRIEAHALWLSSEGKKGSRLSLVAAELHRINLEGADLREANLFGIEMPKADLSGANLSGADLFGANLSRAILADANLSNARLRGANLFSTSLVGAKFPGADLSNANLSEANLFSANLSGANLSKANLYNSGLVRADLTNANLSEANLFSAEMDDASIEGAKLPHFKILPEKGGFSCFKKGLKTEIIELYCPARAKRTSCLISRKSRIEFGKTISIEKDGKKVNSARGKFGHAEYRVGEYIYADRFDDDICVECTHGIHVFLTRQEAVEF